jgi:hypothetical protein
VKFDEEKSKYASIIAQLATVTGKRRSNAVRQQKRV